MQRRTMLQLTGATFATGMGADRSYGWLRDEHNEAEDDDETEENENEAENEDEEPACEPEIRFGDRELLVDDTGFTPDAYAEIVVENTGDVPSGEITVSVDWLDGDETLLGDNRERLPSLGAGETWLAYVRAIGPEPEEIDDFEVTGEFELGHPRAPDGIEIGETELIVDNLTPEITGVIENTREEVLDQVQVLGKVYDEDGTVLGGGDDIEFDLAAETNWNFEIFLWDLPYQAPELEDYEVMVNADAFRVLDEG